MVVAILVNQFIPSTRGIRPSTEEEGQRPINLDVYHEFEDDIVIEPTTTTRGRSGILLKNPEKGKRKPFRATAALTSLAADFDIISDWLFFWDVYRNDQEYRSEWTNDSAEDPYLVPPFMILILLIVCFSGTFCWLVLATDGRLMAPFMRWFGQDKISMGHMLFMTVLLEDFPQVLLTFLIEDYYEEDSLSGFAICNLMTSVYDTIIKLAEAYDERHDLVETGDWCKESLVGAHHDAVTAVLCIPLPPSATTNTTTTSESNSHHHHRSSTSNIHHLHMSSKQSFGSHPTTTNNSMTGTTGEPTSITKRKQFHHHNRHSLTSIRSAPSHRSSTNSDDPSILHGRTSPSLSLTNSTSNNNNNDNSLTSIPFTPSDRSMNAPSSPTNIGASNSHTPDDAIHMSRTSLMSTTSTTNNSLSTTRSAEASKPSSRQQGFHRISLTSIQSVPTSNNNSDRSIDTTPTPTNNTMMESSFRSIPLEPSWSQQQQQPYRQQPYHLRTPNSFRRSNNSIVYEPAKISRLRFLTASLDKTIRLWDTLAPSSNGDSLSLRRRQQQRDSTTNKNTKRQRRHEKCLRTFRGHMDGITCIAWLGTPLPNNNNGGGGSSSSSNIHHHYHRSNNNNNSNMMHESSHWSSTTSLSAEWDTSQHHHHNDDEEAEYTRYFVSGCRTGNAKLWNLRGDCIRSYYLPLRRMAPLMLSSEENRRESRNGITCIACIKEGNTFVCGYEEGVVRLWEAWTGVCLGVFDASGGGTTPSTPKRNNNAVPPPRQQQQPISCLCSMNDGIHFISASFDGTINLWSTKNVMEAFEQSEATLHVSEDISLFHKESLVDNEIVLVSSSTTQPVSNSATLMTTNHKMMRGGANSSPSPRGGRKRLSMEASKFVLGESSIRTETIPIKTFVSRSNSAVLSVCCVETAKVFCSGSADGVARIWSINTGHCFRSLCGHDGPVSAVACLLPTTISTTTSEEENRNNNNTSGSNLILTGSHDTTVKVWDSMEGICLRTYHDHQEEVTSISVADESTFISCSRDKSIKVWVVSSVPKDLPKGETLDNILEANFGICQMGGEDEGFD